MNSVPGSGCFARTGSMLRGPDFGVRSEFGLWSDVTVCFPSGNTPEDQVDDDFITAELNKTRVRWENVTHKVLWTIKPVKLIEMYTHHHESRTKSVEEIRLGKE